MAIGPENARAKPRHRTRATAIEALVVLARCQAARATGFGQTTPQQAMADRERARRRGLVQAAPVAAAALARAQRRKIGRSRAPPSSAACSSCPHTTREARCSARKDEYLRSAAVRCAQSRSRCGGVGGGRQRSRARRVREAEHGAAARRTCSFHHEDTWALYPLGAALKSWRCPINALHHMIAVTFDPGHSGVTRSDFQTFRFLKLFCLQGVEVNVAKKKAQETLFYG